MSGLMIQYENDVVEVPEEKNPTSLEICLCIWLKFYKITSIVVQLFIKRNDIYKMGWMEYFKG